MIEDYSYRGENTKKFEKILEDYIGSYVACTNTGTAALFLSLLLAGIGKGDYVLCPAISYVATANAILYTGATPIFCDVKDDLNIDIDKLEKQFNDISILKLSKAIVAVHIFGNPCDMIKINNLCKKYSLILIEDACQALGSWYNSKHCGTFGDFGAISFNGNKIITTGGGGALIAKSKKIKEKAMHLSMVSRVSNKDQCQHDGIGYNLRMSAWNALLGLEQWKTKEIYFNHLKDKSKSDKIVSNGWARKDDEGFRIWKPLYSLPHLKDFPRMDCKNAERLGKITRYKINER